MINLIQVILNNKQEKLKNYVSRIYNLKNKVYVNILLLLLQYCVFSSACVDLI